MKSTSIGSTILATVLALACTAAADVPRLINYQGSLTDENGYPLHGQHVLTFKMYYVLAGGTPRWEESHLVDVYEGLYNVILGGTTAIVDSLFENQDLWMGLTVDSDPELVPRMRLTTVPWAYRSAVAETSMTVGSHNHDSEYVNEGQLDAIDSPMVVDNSLTVDDIGPSVLSSLNGLTNDGGNIDLVAGDNVTITPSDTEIEISAALSPATRVPIPYEAILTSWASSPAVSVGEVVIPADPNRTGVVVMISGRASVAFGSADGSVSVNFRIGNDPNWENNTNISGCSAWNHRDNSGVSVGVSAVRWLTDQDFTGDFSTDVYLTVTASASGSSSFDGGSVVVLAF
jgi:hypothetical protein